MTVFNFPHRLAEHLKFFFSLHRYWITSVISCFYLVVFTGCDQTSTSTKVLSVVQGNISSPATGMKTAYRNIEASSAKLIMNDEVLGHSDIPLGEKFYIINEGIKGLTVKDGNVAIGCALEIKDESGNTIMNEADLFNDNSLFKKEEVNQLRCAVSTGLPMESENFYTVKARFWDKYGEGFIENVVKIRVIDMP